MAKKNMSFWDVRTTKKRSFMKRKTKTVKNIPKKKPKKKKPIVTFGDMVYQDEKGSICKEIGIKDTADGEVTHKSMHKYSNKARGL